MQLVRRSTPRNTGLIAPNRLISKDFEEITLDGVRMVEMSNATLTSLKGFQARNPDLTITVDRADLNQVMMGQASFDDLIARGKAKFEGDREGFDQLRSILVAFTPDFEILPGTAAKTPAEAPKPFEVRDLVNPEVGD